MSGKSKIVRSEDVQEILSRPPRTIVRVGSAIICAIVLVLITGSFIFKYPDTIAGNITLTRNNPPVWIVAKSTGKLKELYVKDNQKVKAGEIIAVIENAAATKDIIKLKQILSRINNNHYGDEALLDQSFNLGDIQSACSAFITALTDYRNFIRNNLYDQQIHTQEVLRNPYQDYRKSIKKQVGMGVEQTQLGQSNYERLKTLYDKGLISKLEFENARKSLIDANMATEQIQSSLSNADVQVAQVNSNIAELKVQRERDRINLTKTLKTSLEELQAAIKKWEETYVLASPINGTVSYNNVWNINQNINTGDKVFAITGNATSNIIGKVNVNTSGAGKISGGQRVNIMLDNYPYMEFGYVTSNVKSVSSMPDDNKYVVTVSVKSPIITSNNKHIPFSGDLSGTAEIQTDQRSLGMRLIEPLKYLFDKNIR